MPGFPVRSLVFAAALVPLGLLILETFQGTLGPNPASALIDRTGEWALHLLLITLAVTPLRRVSGWRWPGKVRRQLGLFAFFYTLLHFAAYAAFDQSLRLSAIWLDLWDRPFITVGFVAMIGLIPLAATSTTAAMIRMGAWWPRLHRSVYLLAVLSVLHYYLLVKADIREPLIYALILGILLGLRMLPRSWLRRMNPTRRGRAQAQAAPRR
ncbi:sulfite oxidase heme-binding subunit YedZ [Thiohalorhabdus methylotrophus]|uniref:Protein-methionine-sulfoxide reductase heme-binding subunit MsrQ n=1 Tax=Thiohalorhabdus methylotrophus TaxID=3242694 RepID=A0ABV4TY43_9GAMM